MTDSLPIPVTKTVGRVLTVHKELSLRVRVITREPNLIICNAYHTIPSRAVLEDCIGARSMWQRGSIRSNTVNRKSWRTANYERWNFERKGGGELKKQRIDLIWLCYK